jgi:formylglycine-generating enzyme required for sulfatase activity
MVTSEDVEKSGEIVPPDPTSNVVEFSMKIPLSEKMAHSISRAAKFLEQGDSIPGEPVSGGKVRGGMVVAVSSQYVVKKVSVWVQVDSLWDIAKPEQVDRGEEVFRFTPIDGAQRIEIPSTVRRLLGVEPTATPSVDTWADVLEAIPDSARIPDAGVRDRIEKSGFPWLVRERISGMEMVLVPPGEFSMGFPDAAGEADEHPQHRVRISRPFYVGRYEVTQGEYVAVMGQNPSFDHRSPRLPVEEVSFEDISERDGFLARTGLRLPTEAEWEYVAHGLKETDYPRGVMMTGDCANYLAPENFKTENIKGLTVTDSRNLTKEVGSFEKSVSWCGAYDMAGNVAEWCSDVYDSRIYETYARMGTVEDPVGPRLDPRLPHVIRGGSFISLMNDVRCAQRNRNIASARHSVYGFRCARTP